MKNANMLLALAAGLSMGMSGLHIGGRNRSYELQPTGRNAKSEQEQLTAQEKAKAKREMRAAKRLLTTYTKVPK